MVLKHTLQREAEELKEGRFPSPALLAHFGHATMSARLQYDIDTRDARHAGRRKTLLELWSDGARLVSLVNLPPGIHEAFDLPVLPDVQEMPVQIDSTEDTATLPPPVQPLPADQLPADLTQMLGQLDVWGNGGPMPQTMAQTLREFIYEAIVNRLPWNDERMLKGHFTGPGKSLRNTSIWFVRQVTKPPITGIQITLPLEGTSNPKETTLVFQAILKYRHFGHWRFPNGPKELRMFARHLETWCDEALRQLRLAAPDAETFWDPVPAVVEILAIGSRMAGWPAKRQAALEEHVDALFRPWSHIPLEHRTPEWRETLTTLAKHRDNLLSILRARIPCTKGSATQLQIIDAAQLIEPLSHIRKDWIPEEPLPERMQREYQVIEDARKIIQYRLPAAVQAEQAAIKAWLEIVRAGWDNNKTSKDELVRILKQAVVTANEAGMLRGERSETLPNVIERFRRHTEVVSVFEQAERVVQAATYGERLMEASLDNSAMVSINQFMQMATECLNRSLEHTQAQIGAMSSGDADPESLKNRIRRGLDELTQLAHMVKGSL
jgi:hypothetical protein